jgi:hypothetical protein
MTFLSLTFSPTTASLHKLSHHYLDMLHTRNWECENLRHKDYRFVPWTNLTMETIWPESFSDIPKKMTGTFSSHIVSSFWTLDHSLKTNRKRRSILVSHCTLDLMTIRKPRTATSTTSSTMTGRSLKTMDGLNISFLPWIGRTRVNGTRDCSQD